MFAGFAPGLARCPQCQLSVDSKRAVCPACGSVLPLELLLRNTRLTFRQALWTPGTARLSEMILWLLACMPLLIAPPVLAIGLSLVRGFRTARHGEIRYNPYIAAVAVTNIALSVAFWLYVGQHISNLISQITHWISLHSNPLDIPSQTDKPQYI